MAGQERTAQLTIVGAGIVGLCSAIEASRAGLTVTVIDRLPPGEATSHGIAGVISPWSVVPQAMPGIWKNVPKWLFDPKGPVKVRWRDLPAVLPWVRRFFSHATEAEATRVSDAMALLMHDNMAVYADYLTGSGAERLIRSSHLITVYRDGPKPDLSDLGSRLRLRHGADLDVLDGPELRELEPDLSPDIRYGVVVRNQARTVDPGAVCKALARIAEGAGVRFLRAEVRSIRPEGDGFLLEGPGLSLPAPRVLLAAGAWSAKLLKPLGIDLPLIGERGYHLVFTDPGVRLRNSISDGQAKVILSEMDAGIRIAGTAEFADPDAPPNYARARALRPLAERLLPGLRSTPAVEWMGVRPSFPDNLPVIGRLGAFENLFGAFGHSHYGFGMAPQTARIAVDLLTGKRANQDLSFVAPDRFAPGGQESR